MTGARFAAVDLGATSGRVIVGSVSSGTVHLAEVRRFGNTALQLPGGLYWDIRTLYRNVLDGLASAAADPEPLTGVAVDSWAVDYGLLTADGALLADPRCYRDPRHLHGVAAVHAEISAEALYAANGLQHQPFNTIFQLRADHDLVARAERALLVPDLLQFWLSDVAVSELTNLSTTGLLEVGTAQPSDTLLRLARIPVALLGDIVAPGRILGPLSHRARLATGLADSVRVSTVASHDTASAVVATPASSDQFAYISCGTWGLVGVELTAPVVCAEARNANFTNERGLDGTIRFQRNVMGLRLLTECLRSWGMAQADLPALLAAAADVRQGPIINPDEPQFLTDGDLPALIAAECARTGQPVPSTAAQFVRCILDSLAEAFARAVGDAARLSGKDVEVVHLVGGGSRNELLCRLTAKACGLPVVAGPVEATALGNVLVQARTYGALTGDLADLRAVVRAGERTVRYAPAERS